MTLEWMPGLYTICQLADLSQVDWPTGRQMQPEDLFFLARTDEECSLVCPSGREPANAIAREPGWCAFRVSGPLDFGLVGIMSRLASALAAADVSIFAVSTFSTDYILVRETSRAAASAALSAAGWRFSGGVPAWT